MKVVESTSPLGSWFNRNQLIIKDNGILFQRSGIFEKRNLSIPYPRIKKISFMHGLFWDRITITTTFFSLYKKELYVLNDNNFMQVRDEFKAKAGAQIIIEEKKSITNQALHPFKD
jgi:hypothetical protein